MSRGLQAGARGGGVGEGDRRAARCRSPELGIPGRPGRPATLRRPRAEGSAVEGPPAAMPPSGASAAAADAHSARARPAARPPARPAAPGRMRRTTRQSGDGGRGGRAPGRRTRPRAAIADPRPRARPPAPAPHLISGRVRARGRPSHKSVQPARREEERRVRSRAHHPRPPAPGRPGARSGMLPCEPPYYGATKLRALPAPLQSPRPPSLLCSLAPAYLLISLRRLPRPARPTPSPPTGSPPPRPQVGGDNRLPIGRRRPRLLSAPTHDHAYWVGKKWEEPKEKEMYRVAARSTNQVVQRALFFFSSSLVSSQEGVTRGSWSVRVEILFHGVVALLFSVRDSSLGYIQLN